ncbi:MAG: NFACT RNA binding domain-containing protein [Candidatus Kapabacteria bacterium]|nr:NFACT RNA binding domain-containing protein [Candidatus Kapabacteria bacterium]
MIRNYHTLKHTVKEFKQLIGFKVIEVFSQEKDILVFSLYDGETFRHIIFDATTDLSCIYLKNQFHRAKANSVDLFPDVVGEIIQDIGLLENERIIDIKCIHTNIIFFLFGGAKSNCLILNHQDIILDSFKKNDDIIETKFELKEQRLKKLSEFQPESSIQQALVKSKFLLSKELAAEFCLLEKIPAEKKISEFTQAELINIEQKAIEFIDILEKQNEYFLLKNEKNELIVSMIPLKNYPDIIFKSNSISHCIYQKYKSLKITDVLEERIKGIQDFLSKELKKMEKKLQDIKLAESNLYLEEQYRSWAVLLSSQPDIKKKGLKSITLIDFNGNEIVIPLDDKLNLIENAQLYFQKSRKTRLNIENRKKFLPEINEKLNKITSFLESLNSISNMKDLEKLVEDIRNTGFKIESENKNDPSSKYRQFDLGEGYTLYVGKSAANNDELTFKFAKQNDLWFHARGSSGAHAVLPLEKNQKPSKQILQKAASIAAYYSGMKNAKYVPVAYTHRKYIKKPKGANPGSVVLMREEVIMVEPKLPDET